MTRERRVRVLRFTKKMVSKFFVCYPTYARYAPDYGFSRSTTSYSFLGNGVWYTREWNTQCQSITGTPSASPTATPAPSPPSTTAVAPSAHPNLRVSSSALACESGTDSGTSVSHVFGVFGGGSVNRASAPGARASTASAPPASSSRSISETSRRAGADATATTSPAKAPGAPAATRQPAASAPEAPGSYGSLHHGARRRLGPEGAASAPRSGPRLQPALPRVRPHAAGPPRAPASVAAAALVGCRDAPAPDAPLSGGRRAHDVHRARGAGGKFDVHM